MLNKLTINLIAFLMCLCMVSVGFSAWTITAETEPATVNGSITADKVINNNDYITPTTLNVFTYCPDGFVTEEGNNGYRLTNEAYITATYTLKLSECKKLFTENSLQATFTLDITNDTVDDANSTLFKAYLEKTATINDTPVNVSIESSNGYCPVITHTFTNILSGVSTDANQTTTITLKYKITFNQTAEYSDIYRVLNNNGTPAIFKIDTMITGA